MDKVVCKAIYEDSNGRRYTLRGCPLAEGMSCYCTGACNEKIYLDEQVGPKALFERLRFKCAAEAEKNKGDNQQRSNDHDQ